MVGALAIGVSYDLFWHLTPKKLESFYKADKIKRERRDEEAWFQGMYFAYALDSTVCNNFLWRGKGSQPHNYVEKPFLQNKLMNGQEETEKTLTEEEKKRKTEQLFLKLQIMGANHNLAKQQKQEQ